MGDTESILGLLAEAARSRDRLLEHEVYRLVALATGIAPPRHVFVPAGTPMPPEEVGVFASEGVVLKVVSPDVVHKSEAGGVRVCTGGTAEIAGEVERFAELHRSRGATVLGTLVVERVRGDTGIGAELFVGIRDTREFGPVIAAGLGGTATEYLAGAVREDRAIARAVVLDSSAGEFFDRFRETVAYDLLSGRVRGCERRIADERLLACFEGFMELARSCRGSGARIAELEVNPFAVRDGALVPLDGRARLTTGEGGAARPPRPVGQIARLLEPESIAVVGVSARSQNFGRIILGNILACGFPPPALRVIKPGVERIDGVRCVGSIAGLDRAVDLLVVAAGADQLPGLVTESVESGLVRSLVVIPGGVGETEDSAGALREIQGTLAGSRERDDRGPVLIGPNCLGVQSRPGRYDTFFVPESKLDKRLGGPGRPVAIVSQSGAFIVSRLSCLGTLDPRFTVSIGNQADLTVGDMLGSLALRDDVDVVGVYVEGFVDLDGLATLGAIRRARGAGKTVVLYKAGRTEQGRSAAAGHTASLAGDYAICRDGAQAAGALIAESFAEFEQLLELSAGLRGKAVTGARIGAISNAGFETVGMADRVRGEGYRVDLPELSATSRGAIAGALAAGGLSSLVNVRNPLDLTPMAGEAAYGACARAMLDDEGVDALVVSVVPLTPALATTPDEIASAESLADVVSRLAEGTDKPIVAVIDAGDRYGPMAWRLREAGVPVMRTADQAMRVLGRYIVHRLEAGARLSGDR